MYGKENYTRKDLLFFKTLEDLLKAEELIIDHDFRNEIHVMNYHFNFDHEEIRRVEAIRISRKDIIAISK